MTVCDEGPPLGQAVLVCELRASQGTAWFDGGSLEIVRLLEGG
ncbi:MAG: hypothetical protein ACUVYA_03890 [Planctomycetota bacterium]